MIFGRDSPIEVSGRCFADAGQHARLRAGYPRHHAAQSLSVGLCPPLFATVASFRAVRRFAVNQIVHRS
jgi:hypothetical protein